MKPHPRPLSKGRGEIVSLEGEASPPAPLQRERGGSKLRGCDSQDRAIQTISAKSVKSVKSVGQERRGRSNGGVEFDVQKKQIP